ncbi:Uncharacterised protein [Chlamydia trachomatis]|nr:Uncharacterised protein [Chlamydia trachomatis]
MDFKPLLNQYERLTTEIKKLKEEYRKASMMSEKMRIDDELYDKETELKKIFKEFG